MSRLWGHDSLGTAVRSLALWVLTATAFLILTALIPGIDVPRFTTALLTTALIALLNAALWPLLIRIALPLTVLTFGLGSLVLNAVVINLAIAAVDGSHPSFLGAIGVAFFLTLMLLLLTPLVGLDPDARALRIVRRRFRKAGRDNRTDVPGVILFEIDGLAEPVLRRAIADGHAPTMARWLEEGSHRLLGWECDLSSQTGASQAGLLLGSNHDMPAFRWYEKESDRTMVSNRAKDAREIERRRSDGGGLLAAGGTSRGNMFSGDAPRCSATMAAIGDRSRGGTGEFFAYFADPFGFTRTVLLYFWDVLSERLAARRQRRSGAEHVDRGGLYPFMRGAITVVMRDLNMALLLGDVVEGVPVTYSTFVGYDEVAHHSGIEEPDAFAVLKRHDSELERLERAIEQAPRPYHLVVLSDHGQSQGRPFRQRYGETLEELVERGLGGVDVFAPDAPDEGVSSLGGALTEARAETSVAGRIVERATRKRLVDGEVALGENRRALEQLAADGDHPAVVLASGGLGLIYLRASRERMSVGEIGEIYPGLIETLADHPGIGFVMVRADEGGGVAIGAGGARRLADDSVTGSDPLAGFGVNAANHLRRTDSFPHCPDILVNCIYDPADNEVAPFEEFMGSHGALGGWQMHPFALVPSHWSEEDGPIVGAETMHATLRAWIAKTGLEVRPHGAGGAG
ncbi:MAG: phage holin family protein [Solirubrobacterales bacterium]